MKTGYDVVSGEFIINLTTFEAHELRHAISLLRGNKFLTYEQECLLSRLDDFLNK